MPVKDRQQHLIFRFNNRQYCQAAMALIKLISSSSVKLIPQTASRKSCLHCALQTNKNPVSLEVRIESPQAFGHEERGRGLQLVP